ncbi:MAG: hypothetical protein QW786_02135 [Candidatus Hadarchaeum sp.]
MKPTFGRCRRIFLASAVVFILVLSSSGLALADLSFEQELTDWNVVFVEDTWSTTSNYHTAQIITTRYSAGSKSLYGGSEVVGDSSYWYYKDFTETIFWTSYQDFRNLMAIKIDMTDIQRQTSHYSWGYGMEISLVLSDGVNHSRSLLWCRHEEPYWLVGIEDNPYELSFIGADGTTWYRYGTKLTPDRWGITDFGGGPLANVNLANARLGIAFSCVSWHNSPQRLWVKALVDNIQLIRDLTPPTVTVSISGTEGNNGWYTSNVVVALKATDNEKGVDRTEYSFDGVSWLLYTSPVVISSEGKTDFYYRSFDKAGNMSSSVLVLKIDKSPPVISATRSPEANNYGWNNGSVTVHFEAADNISGLDFVTPDTLVSTEGVNQSVTGTATDMAGNSASVILSGINIDVTRPVITIRSPEQLEYSPTENVALDFSVFDSLSGVSSLMAQLDGVEVFSGQLIDLSKFLGRHRLIVIATDAAGNMETSSVEFSVIIPATVDVCPDVLNLKSKSDKNAVTAFIELPEGYLVEEIDAASVKLDIGGTIVSAQSNPSCVGDYDGDGVADLMVKFNRAEVVAALGAAIGQAKITVKGRMNNGLSFAGEDILRVIMSSK